jgi:type III restriction enzyme
LDLKNDGEEFECAREIDLNAQVKLWVRNLVRHETSYSFPTATDRFYPDFLVELRDGRRMIVEYKGEGYRSNDDSAEKRSVGELWERTSGGQCLFLMAVKEDQQGRGVAKQISDKIGGLV